ncbi:MAG: hypothetical protein ACLQAR_01170 [Steroidobacteraceae bacterium]
MKTRIGAIALLGLAALIAAGSASADGVYSWTGGGLDFTGITVDGSSVLSGSPNLALTPTSSATIGGSDTTLSFAIGSGGTINLTGTASFVGSGGKTNTLNFSGATFTLSGLSGDSISPLSLSGSGGNYTFSSGVSNGIAISGNWSLAGATDTVGKTTTPVNVSSTAFGPNDQPISGTVALTGSSMQNLTMDGVPLGTFSVDGQSVAVTANIIFDGATPVPVPASMWLLGSALGLLSLSTMRRRAAG